MIQPWRYPHLFQLWQDWLQQGQSHQLDHWLKQWFKQHKQYGKKDRKAYADALFNSMRFLNFALYAELEYSQQSVSLHQIEPAKFWYWVLLRSQTTVTAPRELENSEQRLAFFQALQSHCAQQPVQSEAYCLWFGIEPQWLEPLSERARLSNWSDAQLHSFLEAQTQPAPLWLRAQGMDVDRLQSQLAQQHIASHTVALSPTHSALRVDQAIDLGQSAAYKQGHVEVQDAASQLLAATVTASPGQTVWEPCAGAGGKSLAIASRTGAAVLASDIRSNALKQAKLRIARAGLANIDTLEHDATQAIGREFDWIFIDAPCSSSGTWRRSPDARHRLSADKALSKLQADILRNAAQHLKPNGCLIYATCSWLAAENEQQITQFLQQSPQFTVEQQSLLGCPSMNSDTMWYSQLRRIA